MTNFMISIDVIIASTFFLYHVVNNINNFIRAGKKQSKKFFKLSFGKIHMARCWFF